MLEARPRLRPAPAAPRVARAVLGAEPDSQALPVLLLVGIGLLCALGGISVAFADFNALYLSIGVIGSLLILYDFRVGAVALTVLLPISASQLFPHEIMGITGLNPLNLLVLGSLFSCLFRMATDRRLPRLLPAPLLWCYILPLIGWGIWGSEHFAYIASDFFRFNEIEFFDQQGFLNVLVIKPLFLVMFAVLTGAAVMRSTKPEKFILPMVVSIWVMCLLAIIYFLSSNATLDSLSGEFARDFFSPLGLHANELGRLYAVAYGLLLFTWAQSSDAGLKRILVASMVGIVVALALTFSRGAFVGFAIVNVLYVLWRGSAKTMGLAVIALIVVAIAVPGALIARLQMGMGGDINAITAGRWHMLWVPYWADLWHSPIVGNGMGSILWSEPMRAGLMARAVHPHNAYLQVFHDMGLIGLVLVSLFWLHVWKGFRGFARDPSLTPEMRGFYQGAAAGLVAMAITNLVGSSFYPVIEQTFLWMAIGMMYGQRLRKPGF
jgi:hypothetical protein